MSYLSKFGNLKNRFKSSLKCADKLENAKTKSRTSWNN